LAISFFPPKNDDEEREIHRHSIILDVYGEIVQPIGNKNKETDEAKRENLRIGPIKLECLLSAQLSAR
jgi:hypothetical protein